MCPILYKFLEMSSILVTGGAGYIGSHVVRRLLRQGYQPIVYDNLTVGHREAVKGAVLIEADLSDREGLSQTFRDYAIEAVMHFAADCLVGESVADPLKYFNNNVKNGLQLLEVMEGFGVRKLVFSSSAAVYGEPATVPIREDHSCVPTNPYGETKLIFERVLQALAEAGKMVFISLRYFNAAGADPEGGLGEDHSPETHLVPLVLQAAFADRAVRVFGTDYSTPDGTCIRDYIHVADLAEAHLLALRRLEEKGDSGIYNLGNGNGYSVREVIETARHVTGRNIEAVESPRRPGDPARLIASSERIRKELGWTPEFPELGVIMETAWRWHKEHPNGYHT